jgi:hypothetical protein
LRKIVGVVLLLLFSAVVGKSWHWAKDGFSLARTHVWSDAYSSPLDEEAARAMNQTFRYLSRGHQCYAFASEDGEYVIKIPRTDRYRLPFWVRALPFPSYREKKREDIGRREAFLLESFQISFDELRDQTALLAMHLSKTEDEGRTVRIVDRLGRSHELPLYNTAFILQRKKRILMDVFQDALRSGKREVACQALDAFLAVVSERARKGILNKDPSFIRNFGFDGTKAFQIDIGSFYRRKGIVGREAYCKSIRETMAPVRDWLADLDPSMLQLVDEKLERLYREPL